MPAKGRRGPSTKAAAFRGDALRAGDGGGSVVVTGAEEKHDAQRRAIYLFPARDLFGEVFRDARAADFRGARFVAFAAVFFVAGAFGVFAGFAAFAGLAGLAVFAGFAALAAFGPFGGSTAAAWKAR